MAYTFKKYPQTLHRWENQTITVQNDDECAQRVADGWSERPVLAAPVVIEVPVVEDVAPEPEPEAPQRRGRTPKGRERA